MDKGSKWDEIKRGERVVMSGTEMDRLEEWLFSLPEQSEDYNPFPPEIQQVPPPRCESILYRLAVEYHERTESFDRRICTGRVVDGEIMPGTGEQRTAIERNALNVRKSLLAEAERLGYSDHDFQRAIIAVHSTCEPPSTRPA